MCTPMAAILLAGVCPARPFCPGAGKPGHAPSRNAKIGASTDQHFFQPSNIVNGSQRLRDDGDGNDSAVLEMHA